MTKSNPLVVSASEPRRNEQQLAKGMRPRPSGQILSEPDSASHVREMFSRIAPRYDFLNHLLSFSLDRLWRRRVARRFGKLLLRDGTCVVDLCCGTGDLAIALASQSRAEIIGCDFARPMLALAAEKAGRRGARVHLAQADVLSLPFPDAQFDLAMSAFGFRNLANYEKGLREICRVLKPGGWAGILEFSLPQSRGFGRLWRSLFGLYFRHILPRVGTVISGVAGPYQYLPESVYAFPLREELVRLMESAGLVEASFEEWTGGIVALHTARRGIL